MIIDLIISVSAEIPDKVSIDKRTVLGFNLVTTMFEMRKPMNTGGMNITLTNIWSMENPPKKTSMAIEKADPIMKKDAMVDLMTAAGSFW